MSKILYTQKELRAEWARRKKEEDKKRLERLKLYDIVQLTNKSFIIPGVQDKIK